MYRNFPLSPLRLIDVMSLGLPTCSIWGTCLRDLPLPSPDTPVLPHHDLLTSNDRLLLEDIQSVRGCLREHDLQISHLDRLLDDMKKAEAFAISRRAEHVRLAKAYRGALSPIRELPAEILAEIFLLCVKLFYDTLSTDNPPWTFGKVSRRWRSVALSAPQLWNQLPQLTTEPVSDFYLQLLSTSLRLSRESPLCFDFEFYSHHGSPIPVVNVISPHIHRCQSLVIWTDADCLLSLDQVLRGITRSLHLLSIHLYGDAEEFVDFQSLSTFQLPLNIRHLVFEASDGLDQAVDNGPFIYSWLKIAWSNLTTFSGVDLQMRHVTELLQIAPSLVQCSFTQIFSSRTNHFTTIDHTNLRSLDLDLDIAGASEFPVLGGLLDCLTLPSLAKLSIPLVAGIASQSLISFFMRSSYSLSTLTFTGDALDDMSPLLASLVKAPLTGLYLKFDWRPSVKLVRLASLLRRPQGDKLPFLPHLQHITVNCPYSMKYDNSRPPRRGSFGFLNQLIESRLYLAKTMGTNALETVTLGCEDARTATHLFDQLTGWSEMPPQLCQPSYARVREHWLQAFRTILKRLKSKEMTSLHEVLLEVETCDFPLNIPLMSIHELMICTYLPLLTKLPDGHFENGDQYQLRRRASLILADWKDLLEDCMRCPGWRIGMGDQSCLEYTLSYSTAGRDYLTFREPSDYCVHK